MGWPRVRWRRAEGTPASGGVVQLPVEWPLGPGPARAPDLPRLGEAAANGMMCRGLKVAGMQSLGGTTRIGRDSTDHETSLAKLCNQGGQTRLGRGPSAKQNLQDE